MAWRGRSTQTPVISPAGDSPAAGRVAGEPMTRPRRYCARANHDTWASGRDAGHRCMRCCELDAQAREREYAAAAAEREAERQRRQDEFDRLRDQKFQAAIAAGGEAALAARWWRLYYETPDSWDLCQWPTPGGDVGGCFRRCRDTLCSRHHAQDRRRELAAKRRTETSRSSPISSDAASAGDSNRIRKERSRCAATRSIR